MYATLISHTFSAEYPFLVTTCSRIFDGTDSRVSPAATGTQVREQLGIHQADDRRHQNIWER